MPFRHLRGPAIVCGVAFALLASACTDRTPTTVSPPGNEETSRTLFTCTANVQQPSLRCDEAFGGGGASQNIILGGQGTYLRLVSTDPGYDGSSTFQVDVTVQNLLSQRMGTPDGTTVHGVKVFFSQLPVVSEGSGEVTVANPDGTGDFTGFAQPYFAYVQILEPHGTSAARPWRFSVPPTVVRFRFSVLVETQLEAEAGVLRWMLDRGEAAAGGVPFDAVWGATPRDVFAVGGRWIMAYDSAGWVPVADAGVALYDIWGTSRFDVYTAGDSGRVLRYDGNRWNVSRRGTPQDQLSGLWSDGQQVLAVGRWREAPSGEVDGLILRSGDAGASWQAVRVPGAGKRYLRDVFRVGDNVYVVGFQDPDVPGASPRAGVVMRSTDGGQTWTDSLFTGPTAITFLSLWADGPEDVVIAGERVSATGTRDAYILRTADGGDTWSTDVVPSGARTMQNLWRVPGGDLYAVGTGRLLVHDGVGWRNFYQGHCLSITAPWTGVWGSSPDNVFMATIYGVWRWDGVCIAQVPQWQGPTESLAAVTADAEYVLAVGSAPEVDDGGNTLFYRGTLRSKLFGGSWYKPSFQAPDSSVFEDVWMEDRYFALVPGWRQTSTGGSHGILLRSLGPSFWEELAVAGAADTRLTAVWGTGRGNAWVFGVHAPAGGSRSLVILHSTDAGNSWTQTSIPWRGTGIPEVTDAWGSSAGAIHVVGHAESPSAAWPGTSSESFTLRYDGTRWTLTVGAGDGVRLTGVWSHGSTVFASGYRTDPAARRYLGLVRRSDNGGLDWTDTALPTVDGDGRVNGIWGTSPSSVYTVASRGVIQHFDGDGWSTVLNGMRPDLFGVAGISDSDVWAVGSTTVLHGVR